MPADPIVEIGRIEDAACGRGPGCAAINGPRDRP